jgi:cell division protein FtsQ
MPLSPEFPARVIIAGGYIKPIGKIRKYRSIDPDQLQYKKLPSDLQKIYVTSMEIRKDVFSNSLIEQLFLNEEGEIEMFPKIGQQIIMLGDTSQVKEKLRNLKVFYTDGMKTTGWDSYKTINLKYRNQVVCTKTK